MLIDMHAHSSGISKCCLINANEVVKCAKEKGIDGIVLTNHYVDYYAVNGDYDDLARRYIKEYEYAKSCGEKIGVKVFFGIEVTMELPGNPHVLVYGIKPEFILKHPKIFAYSIDRLYFEVILAGGTVVQAHPYRKNQQRLLDVRFLDGVEVNCHPLYEGTHLQRLTLLAQEKGLILTCGGDYHADAPRPKCGVYFPDEIETGEQIGFYIKTSSTLNLCVQEVNERTSKDISFTLNKDAYTQRIGDYLSFMSTRLKKGEWYENDDDLLLKIYHRISDKAYNLQTHRDDLSLLSEPERIFFVLYLYDYEIQNGGLCQFFVNIGKKYASYLFEYLTCVNAVTHKQLLNSFILKNNIDLSDLSLFEIKDGVEYHRYLNLYPFNDFDNEYSLLVPLKNNLLEFAKKNNL